MLSGKEGAWAGSDWTDITCCSQVGVGMLPALPTEQAFISCSPHTSVAPAALHYSQPLSLSLSLSPQSSLMDLMDVPEPGASADPWGTGAASRAAAVSEDPWQSYGTDATLARASLRLGALTGDTDTYRCLCTRAPPWQHLDLESLLRRNAASLARLHFCSACLSGRVGVQEEEVMEDTQSLWDL